MFFAPSKLFRRFAFQSLKTGYTRRNPRRRSRLSKLHPTALYRTELLEDRVLLTSTPGLPWLEVGDLSGLDDFEPGDDAGHNVAISGDTIVTVLPQSDSTLLLPDPVVPVEEPEEELTGEEPITNEEIAIPDDDAGDLFAEFDETFADELLAV